MRIDVNVFVRDSYSNVRGLVQQRFPFIKRHEGNVAADQLLRNELNRITVERSKGDTVGNVDERVYFLRRQLDHCGIALDGSTCEEGAPTDLLAAGARGLLRGLVEIGREVVSTFEQDHWPITDIN